MKKICSLIFILLYLNIAYSQYDPKENFEDAEYFFAEKDYSEAVYDYLKLYKEGYQENAHINYKIGICLLAIENRKTESIKYLEKATRNISERYRGKSIKEETAPYDAYLYLANAYRIDKQYDKSIENYQKFLNYEADKSSRTRYARLQIEACSRSKAAMTKNGDFQIATLGQLNHVKEPIYNPGISGDLSTLAFMGRKKFYNGIYVCKMEDGIWLKPYNISPSILSDGNQNFLSLSYDGTEMLLAVTDNSDTEIWHSIYKNKRWYPSEPIGKPINSKYAESHACFSPDGNTIYFTSKRKESIGNMDIFKCEKKEDNTWGDLILLSEHVNTPLNEETPFVSPDGKRLYFSSEGHPGFGGYDIFYCDIKEDGTYDLPVNLGYKLNTSDDDFTFMPTQISSPDYLIIYAKGEANQVDLYRFQWIPENARAMQLDPEIIDESAFLKDNTDEPASYDTVSQTINSTEPALIKSTENSIDTTDIFKSIFFDYDSYKLSDNAINELNKLASVLENFPSIKLEIIGHTDTIGNYIYNQKLAEKRANAASEYLISKGINNKRLEVYSKGESAPVPTSKEADIPGNEALNRRVEINVIFP